MLIGKVIGNIWSTKKCDGLEGAKFLIVEVEGGKQIVACDAVGAGVGEKVLISKGSSASKVFNFQDLPIDASIIGIIDELEGE